IKDYIFKTIFSSIYLSLNWREFLCSAGGIFKVFSDVLNPSEMAVLFFAIYGTNFNLPDDIAIQFSYLFGSLQYGLPQDFTYAEYARKGFSELIAVTLINLLILLGNMNLVKLSGSRADKAVQLLNTFLVIGTVIMLLSAHFRMSLYEEAYGLTYLRVLTHAFMGYLLVLFAATLYKIWIPKLSLLKSFIVISLLAYTLLNYLNIDSLIAKNNIARYQQGNPIDILYLTTLSYEAVPQLVDFMQNTSERELAEKLENGLTSKKEALEKAIPWQSFNLSRDRARKTLFPPD
ncbi:MAG TPA: DUF4173 domain-containing protein, partial [Desulfitobacteriaceae bacterium]|nr:DUF4173 domain-containing protein [Desulfitobacteriaceae bacterium]